MGDGCCPCLTFGLKLAIAKVFLLVLFPLAVCLPLWLTVGPSVGGESALLFFMLIPHALYPVIWMVLIARDKFDAEDYLTEFLLLGCFSGLILPAIILPILLTILPLPEPVATMVLGFIITLLAAWLPLLIGSLWAPLAVEDFETAEMNRTTKARHELIALVAGLFLTLAFPLGVILPVFVSNGKNTSASNQEAMIIFAVGCNLAGFMGLLASRIGVRLHVAGPKLGPTRETPEMMIKLVYGCCIIPMLVLLPVYMGADLDHRPRRAVLSCMLGTPLLAVVEAVRTAHTRDSDGILKRMGVAMFLLILPFGVLLPIWLSVAPGEVGETALLIAGLVSIAAVLIAVTVLTCTVQPHLPFAMVDYWIDGGSTSPNLDKMFAVFVFLLPPTFLLPLYFEAQVSNAGGLTTLSFLGIYEVLVAVMYWVSIKERGTMGQNGVTFIESRSRPVSMLAARPVSNSSL